MSIYESIMNKEVPLKQRLFDQQIHTFGQEMRVVRLRGKEDIYQDMKDINIISKDFITVIIRFPDEIPLERFRYDSNEWAEDTRVFFFDLLPIDVYTKIEDRVEVRDLLFFEMRDENRNPIPMLLQVTEVFGKFEGGLVWKRSQVAPQHGALTQELYKELTTYYDSKTENPLVREEPTEEDQDLVREKRLREIMK